MRSFVILALVVVLQGIYCTPLSERTDSLKSRARQADATQEVVGLRLNSAPSAAGEYSDLRQNAREANRPEADKPTEIVGLNPANASGAEKYKSLKSGARQAGRETDEGTEVVGLRLSEDASAGDYSDLRHGAREVGRPSK